ncbi:MAG: TetR/AcrR family transcriptional regulator [Amphiplicatus sp.]
MTKGRPRAFDRDAALDKALDLFWAKGFEGVSIADLTEAMGVNPPSLYAAFGNKEALFREALDRYEAGPGGYINAALAEPDARAVAAALLEGCIAATTGANSPRGCLVVQGALACGDDAAPLREELQARRRKAAEAVRRRFVKAKADGELPRDAEPGDLARYLMAVINGLSVLAADGAGRPQMRRVADQALRAMFS